MIMAYWKFIIFMALFASNANELANWQLTVPAKEHISSYQIVSDNWKIHYSINGNEYQYYLGGEEMKIVYYSGTGNTEKMANLIAKGIVSGGKDAEVVNVSAAGLDIFDNEDVVILGCPAMGDEVLEEGEFEPFIEGISSKISGKKVALFGSYGWGDGQWMRDWQERMESLGCTLIDDGLIINYEPEDESPECINFGLKIAKV